MRMLAWISIEESQVSTAISCWSHPVKASTAAFKPATELLTSKLGVLLIALKAPKYGIGGRELSRRFEIGNLLV